jgi:mRNA interferase YafQ
MRRPLFTNQFEKDARLMRKRGKDLGKLRLIVERLSSEETIEPRYRDHALTGNYRSRRECHIEPDWLLIYKLDEIENEDRVIIFERTGSHSDLFE